MAFQRAAHPAATRAYRDTENEHPELPGNMQRTASRPWWSAWHRVLASGRQRRTPLYAWRR